MVRPTLSSRAKQYRLTYRDGSRSAIRHPDFLPRPRTPTRTPHHKDPGHFNAFVNQVTLATDLNHQTNLAIAKMSSILSPEALAVFEEKHRQANRTMPNRIWMSVKALDQGQTLLDTISLTLFGLVGAIALAPFYWTTLSPLLGHIPYGLPVLAAQTSLVASLISLVIAIRKR